MDSILEKFFGKLNSRFKTGSFFTRKRLIIILTILLFLLCTLLALLAFFAPKTTPSEKPRFLFSIIGRASEPLITPFAVAVSGTRVYVVDSERGRVEVYDTERQFLFDFQVRVTPLEGEVTLSQASYPVGIAIGRIGNEERVFVSDLRDQKILVFDANGRFLEFLENGSLKKPLALAFFKNKLYVTDIGDHTVKIFTSDGKLLKKIGRSGSKGGEFSFPNGIFVDKLGKILVADSNNGRVQVFGSDGKYERQFGKSSGKKLSLPRGIAVDGKNRVHVVDALAHEVFVFNGAGKLLLTYGGEKGQEREKLSFPNGIAIDNSNQRIFITDRGNSSVSVWEY